MWATSAQHLYDAWTTHSTGTSTPAEEILQPKLEDPQFADFLNPE